MDHRYQMGSEGGTTRSRRGSAERKEPRHRTAESRKPFAVIAPIDERQQIPTTTGEHGRKLGDSVCESEMVTETVGS